MILRVGGFFAFSGTVYIATLTKWLNLCESCIYPINPSEAMETEDNTIDVMDDAQAYIELIKENISYEYHMKYDKYGQRELYDELFEVICEVVCVKRQTIRVAGEEYV